MSPKLFVSHSTLDTSFATKLVNDLNAVGAQAWMDVTDLGAGDFQENISKALGDCEWFVLVLTPYALASPWVTMEVDAAIRLKHQKRVKELIFIKAEDIDHTDVPALWGVFNIFDATADYDAALAKVVKALGLGLPRRETRPMGSFIDVMIEPMPMDVIFDLTPPAQHASEMAQFLGFRLNEIDAVYDKKQYEAAFSEYSGIVLAIEDLIKRGRADGVDMQFLNVTCHVHLLRAWAGVARAHEALGHPREAKEARRMAKFGRGGTAWSRIDGTMEKEN